MLMDNTRDKDETRSCLDRKVRALTRGAGRILKSAEIVLLLLGIALLVYYGAARYDRYLNSRAAINAFETLDEAPATRTPPAPAEELNAEAPDFADWNAPRVAAYKDALWKRGGASLAVLEIPKISLRAPVLDGTDSLTLNRAVGRIAGTARPGEPGKIAIAGHRDSFFRGLKDIAPGDALDLRTHVGKYVYVVDRIQIVAPRDVSVLQPEDTSALTLVTCYPFYYVGSAPKRFVVTAYLTEYIPAGSELRPNLQPRSSTKETQ